MKPPASNPERAQSQVSAYAARAITVLSTSSPLQLLGILLLSFALRAVDVTQPLTDAFAWREASTAMMADNLPRNGWNPLWPEVSWTGDNPGYQGREFQSLSMFAALLDLVFGWADWHGRLVAAIFGTLTTLAIYQIVRQVFGKEEGLGAALVYATLPGAIVIDRAYLPDPAMLGLVTAGLWLLFRAMSTQHNGFMAGAWILLTAGFLAKLPSLTVLPAVAYLFVLDRHRISAKRWAAYLLGAAVSAVAIAAYYRWAIHLGRTHPPFHVAGNGWLWQVGLHGFWAESFYLPSLLAQTHWWFVTPAFVLLALLGFLSPVLPSQRLGYFFHLTGLGALALVLVAAKEVDTNPWNLHIVNLTIAAFAGRGLALALKRVNGARGIRSLLTATAIVAFLVWSGSYAVEKIKQPYAEADRSLGVALNRLSVPSDLVVVSGTEAGMPLGIYYSRRRGWIFPTPEMGNDYGKYGPDGDFAVESLRRLAVRGAAWFGVIKHAEDNSSPPKRFLEQYPSLVEYLRRNSTVSVETDEMIIFDLRDFRAQLDQLPENPDWLRRQ